MFVKIEGEGEGDEGRGGERTRTEQIINIVTKFNDTGFDKNATLFSKDGPTDLATVSDIANCKRQA